MNYRDDFERFAHDIINVVQGNSRSGVAPQWQIDKIAAMLRAGPGLTTWPRDAAEAAQRAREKTLRKPPAVLLPPMKPEVRKPAVKLPDVVIGDKVVSRVFLVPPVLVLKKP